MDSFKRLAIALIVLIPLVGGAQPESVRDAGEPEDPALEWLAALKTCFEKARSIRANFVQDRLSKLGAGEEKMEGTVVARRGGLVRLTYKKPSNRLVVSDGATLWAFDAASKTAVKDDAKKSILPRIFDFVLGGFENGFSVRYLGGERRPGQGTAVLELQPVEADPVVESIALSLNKRCPCVKRILVSDRAGSIVRVTLSDIETNVKLGKGLFTFKPKPGTAVVTP